LNYLAHLFLSGDDEQILFGNFIADHVKGKDLSHYGAGIQKGIRLHRLIDTFTDQHPATYDVKLLLRPYVHKYAPVAADVIFDHFLAAGWNAYHELPLHIYTGNVYDLLDSSIELMPERTRRMYQYMKRGNWLLGYASMEGIRRSLEGLSGRTTFESNLPLAAVALNEHYDAFKRSFEFFFPKLQQAAKDFISET
jgi:acyl carrier protein phosphodiesterase